MIWVGADVVTMLVLVLWAVVDVHFMALCLSELLTLPPHIESTLFASAW